MKVSMGGHTRTGKVIHSLYGEWTYGTANESWCGVTLSGNDHKAVEDVEVTCKRCLKVTPTFTTTERNTAHELLTAYRAGFDTGPAWYVRQDAVLRLVPGWTGGPVLLAKVILNAGK